MCDCVYLDSFLRGFYFQSPEFSKHLLIFFFLFIFQTRRICLPYKTENRPIIGRVLVATRTIKPMELILIDPGTVIGPNYTSKPTCLECLRLVDG